MEGVVMFRGVFASRRVLVTGHTGFKGGWLSHWLLELGAEVHGLALPADTAPALFDLLDLRARLASHREIDIRDAAAVTDAVAAIKPAVVLHLAAQPLVRRAYACPGETWATNVQGTVNVLEAVRAAGCVRACVVVTSDKCYENLERDAGYAEGDRLGGHDPYASSKAAAEIAVASWRKAFFHHADGTRLATARAGNVVGGGDWSPDRLIVDCIAALAAGRPIVLRHPLAIRPWQHVLEPLSGYLWLAARLLENDGHRFAEAWNFGPRETCSVSVLTMAECLISAWGGGRIIRPDQPSGPHEAGILRLDVRKAAAGLGWQGAWDLQRTVRETVAWYSAHHAGGKDLRDLTSGQIAAYASDAHRMHLPWTASA
jgi:CDP-glucose 4,6-dehydratase